MNSEFKNKLRLAILNNFPKNHLKYVFAYGSVAVPQKGNKGKMLDLVLIVNDNTTTHRINMYKNPSHYSMISKLMGPQITARVNHWGTKVYYNPSILLDNDINIKYGLISNEDFKFNLLNWDNLFLAGRLHKPVVEIYSDEDAHYTNQIIQDNRDAAFALTLLKSPKCVDLVDFFIDLANLSYIGDFRTYLKAEKKDKVKNVVLGSFDKYKEIYSASIHKYDVIEQDNTLTAHRINLEKGYDAVPLLFMDKLASFSNYQGSRLDFKNWLLNMDQPERKRLIEAYLRHLNLRYSTLAIMSGLYSTDIHKSVYNC